VNTDDLEKEINARIALKLLKEQLDVIVEFTKLNAQIKWAYYRALVDQGFSRAEALALTTAYDPFRQFRG